jgi:hypothetical protein
MDNLRPLPEGGAFRTPSATKARASRLLISERRDSAHCEAARSLKYPSGLVQTDASSPRCSACRVPASSIEIVVALRASSLIKSSERKCDLSTSESPLKVGASCQRSGWGAEGDGGRWANQLPSRWPKRSSLPSDDKVHWVGGGLASTTEMPAVSRLRHQSPSRRAFTSVGSNSNSRLPQIKRTLPFTSRLVRRAPPAKRAWLGCDATAQRARIRNVFLSRRQRVRHRSPHTP